MTIEKYNNYQRKYHYKGYQGYFEYISDEELYILYTIQSPYIICEGETKSEAKEKFESAVNSFEQLIIDEGL